MRKVPCGERHQADEGNPCVLDFIHQDDHLTALGEAWARYQVARVCCRCCITGPKVTRVGTIDQISGPGWPVWACADCARAVRRLLGQ